MESFLLQATLYLGAGLLAVPIATRLGLGSVLGYLIAGICIGPIFGLVGDMTDLQHFAEFGVVMMLFIIGLELEPKALWDMRSRLIGQGGLQVGLTTGLIMTAAMALGQPWQTGFAIGMIFALSSTAIVLQTLNEKGLMQSNGGRSAFSVLLTQDIAVIPMLAFMPLLAVQQAVYGNADGSISRASDAAHGGDHHGDGHHAALSLVDGLPAWGVTLVTIGAIAAIIIGGMFLTRPLFRFVNGAKLRELNTAFALFIVVGIAVLMNLVGLSPALGAFLAGVVLANSEFRHELESDIEPFKGLLLGLFFITVGAGINFNILFSAPGTILGLTLGVIAIKAFILFVLAVVFKMRGRDRMLFTLSLAQAGEFGFVLISFATQNSVLPDGLSQRLLLVVALSMLITPLLFILYEQLSKRMADTGGDGQDPDEIDEQNQIIIAGIGRFGQVINRMVQMAGAKTTVLDHDLKTIELMRTFGFKGFLGDPTRPELLHAAGIETAKILVVAVDDKDAAVRLVKYARRVRPDIHIVARARDRVHVYELYQAGANDIVREMFDSSLRAGRYVLEHMGWTEYDAAELEHEFFRVDRRALLELAQLWDPDVPIEQNKAYVEKARSYNKDLETQIVKNIQESEEASGHTPKGLRGPTAHDAPEGEPN